MGAVVAREGARPCLTAVALPDGAAGQGESADRIEVRLLGPFQVRRADGSLVQPCEWRTGKTADLLRLLATRAGDVVSVDEILDALWPRSEKERGRGSLRNALGQLRKLLGQAAVERRPDGLVLRGAWVDTVALLSLADEARRHARQGQLAMSVRAAREAYTLHLGELRTHDPDAMWAIRARENLETRFREMTIDAAEHAVELGWMRDGLELGQRALRDEPTSERACRVLMRAYAGLGETERALRVYEGCRAVLAEELGLDPAPQTRALHLEILRPEPVEAAPAPFTGRERDLDSLLGWLAQQRASGTPGVVYLSGGEGSGRTRLVREAALRFGADVDVVGPNDDARDAVRASGGGLPADPAPGTEHPSASGRGAVVVLVSAAARLGPLARHELLSAMRSAEGPVTLVLRLCDHAEAVLARDEAATDARAGGGAGGGAPLIPTLALHLLPLPPAAVEQLATARLCGPPSPGLLDELVARTDGLPGRVVATVDEWCRSGAVAATPQGLALVSPHDHTQNATTELGPLLVRAMEQAGARDQHVLQLVAVLDRPVRPAMLVPVVPWDAHEGSDLGTERAATVLASLDRLVDLQLLATSPEGYVVRDPFLRQAVESWLRPSVRRRLHAVVAAKAPVPASERARHWRAAGEVELATTAALDAVRDAMAVGDDSSARLQLLVAADLAARTHACPEELAGLEESLADVCVAAGRADEAEHHYARAADCLTRTDASAAARLRDKASRAHRSLSVLTSESWPALVPATDAETVARSGDGRAGDTAVVVHLLSDVLLGNARLVERTLDAAWAGADPHEPMTGALAVLRCLVGHDLGRRDLPDRWECAMRLASPGSGAVEWTWARVRMLTERGLLAEAIRQNDVPVSPTATREERQLRALSTAGLHAALGLPEDAVRVLHEAMSGADAQGCALLLPEVTALLVSLMAPADPHAAMVLFERFDWAAVSETRHPRQSYLRLMAHAAVLAGNDDFDRAAAAAATATRIAEDCGLALLASQAYLAQAKYLFESGWTAGARVTTAGDARRLLGVLAAG